MGNYIERVLAGPGLFPQKSDNLAHIYHLDSLL